VVHKALANLDYVSCKVKNGQTIFFDVEIMNDFFEKEHIHANADKTAVEDHVLEQTSIKA
jgi:hypothetical protein